MLQTALKYQVEVTPEGRVELPVPFPPGVQITVFVVQEPPDLSQDLLQATESTLDFWDNPWDDEDWNDA